MSMLRYVAPSFLILVAAPASALPLVSVTGITAGVTGGTLGVGPEVSYSINPFVAVRGSATFLGFGGSGHVGDYRYTGHVHLSDFGGTIDVHPFANGFRLSAGARSTHDNRIRFTGIARSNQTYGGMTFTPDQAGTLSGEFRTRSVSPIATVGYAHTMLSGIMVGIDGGVMFHGHPQVDDLVATGQLGSNPAAQASLANEEQRLRDRARDYPYYPVGQLSLGYRF